MDNWHNILDMLSLLDYDWHGKTDCNSGQAFTLFKILL